MATDRGALPRTTGDRGICWERATIRLLEFRPLWHFCTSSARIGGSPQRLPTPKGCEPHGQNAPQSMNFWLALEIKEGPPHDYDPTIPLERCTRDLCPFAHMRRALGSPRGPGAAVPIFA